MIGRITVGVLGLTVVAAGCIALAANRGSTPASDAHTPGETTMPASDLNTAKPVHLTSENFSTTIGTGDLPVLVDFWAEWCPPCRALLPTIDRLASETQGRAIIGKLNVDQASDVARDHRVQSIPTLIIFRSGREVDRMVGVHSKDEIERRILKAAG